MKKPTSRPRKVDECKQERRIEAIKLALAVHSNLVSARKIINDATKIEMYISER